MNHFVFLNVIQSSPIEENIEGRNLYCFGVLIRLTLHFGWTHRIMDQSDHVSCTKTIAYAPRQTDERPADPLRFLAISFINQ